MTNASAIDTHMVKNLNYYTKIIAQALDEMKKTQGAAFSLEAVNLAELQRMTGISRAKLRRLKENQFETLPDKRCGRKAPKTKLTGYTDYIRSHRNRKFKLPVNRQLFEPFQTIVSSKVLCCHSPGISQPPLVHSYIIALYPS